MPTPRCARKRKRTLDKDMGRNGGKGWTGRMVGGKVGRLGALSRPASPALPAPPALPALEPFVHFAPVDHIPPRVNVIGPAILVLQVVRVFPHVDAEHDLLVLHQRAVLVRGALDGDFAAVVDDPRPAAAEAADRGLLEFLFELVEAAERRV